MVSIEYASFKSWRPTLQPEDSAPFWLMYLSWIPWIALADEILLPYTCTWSMSVAMMKESRLKLIYYQRNNQRVSLKFQPVLFRYQRHCSSVCHYSMSVYVAVCPCLCIWFWVSPCGDLSRFATMRLCVSLCVYVSLRVLQRLKVILCGSVSLSGCLSLAC